MKRLSRRLGTNHDDQQSQKKLPTIGAPQFSTKLNDLLDKISVQNRYASRISQCNMKNLQDLERARDELNKIAEQKKMEELKSSDEKDKMDQMIRRVATSQYELEKLFKEVLEFKKEIKKLKKQIQGLRNENLFLEKQLLQARRQRMNEINATKQQFEGYLLVTQITNFLIESQNIKSQLYKFCLECHKTTNFKDFFQRLDKKLNTVSSERDRSVTTKRNEPISSVYEKLKLRAQSKIPLNSLAHRYKTQTLDYQSQMLQKK